MKTIYYSRTFLSIVGGVIAGILGFTSFTGFVFYFLVMAITSLGIAAKSKFSIHAYFDCWNHMVLDGFLSGLMSFVLFWTAYILNGAARHGATYVWKEMKSAAAIVTQCLLYLFISEGLPKISTDFVTVLLMISLLGPIKPPSSWLSDVVTREGQYPVVRL